MTNPTQDSRMARFCSNCGQPIRPGSRFCGACGQPVEAGDPPAAGTQPGPAHEAPKPPHPTPPAKPAEREAPAREIAPPESPPTTDYQLTLQQVPPAARGPVSHTLRQLLGVDPRSAHAYINAVPVLLAVGLNAETAERLRAALATAGAVVVVREPTAPALAPGLVDDESKPEPMRRLSLASETLYGVVARPGLRTVTGLDVGQTNCYLAFARAEDVVLAAAPSLVSFEAQTAVPSAIRLPGEGQGMAFGTAALEEWVQQPDSIVRGFSERLTPDDEVAVIAARHFLEALARRLNEVLMPGALAGHEGASTTLGVPAGWDESRRQLLKAIALEAGFPVNRILPHPLAALASHLQQGSLHPPGRNEHVMVIDWGGSGLRVSFVEHGPDLARPKLFEHVELPLGGEWFEAALLSWLRDRLSPDLTEEDERALALFAREFKEGLSRSFAEGKKEHAQYCVVPAGAPPARVRLGKTEFEEMTSDALEQFKQALSESVEKIGFKPKHVSQIILTGGSANWYFSRETIRTTLDKVPLIAKRPEETIARGLAVYGLTN